MYLCGKKVVNMANTSTVDMNSVDALWTLIQNQTKNVKTALYRRIIEAEEKQKTLQQQKYVRQSLGRAFDELKEAQASGKELPDARSLFKMMDE